jgi:hypothetical protein
VRAAVIVAVVMVLSGCGGSPTVATPKVTEATLPVAKRLLQARLAQQQLVYHWVVCLRTGRTYGGVKIVRCNVDFGDPHIEAYCSVLVNGRLVTDHDDASIPCRHDDAGPAPSIVQS